MVLWVHNKYINVSLQDKLTNSHSTPTPKVQTNSIGMCTFCSWVSTGYWFTLPNAELFFPWFKADCSTQGIVYPMTCHSGAFYVGKTIRQLRERLNNHIYYSSNGKMLTPVSRHLDPYHRFNTSLVTFLVLVVILQDPRGGDWDKRILQH